VGAKHLFPNVFHRNKTNGWKGALELTNASAIGWQRNASSGQSFGIGQSNGGLYFFRTNSSPGVTLTEAVYDLSITDNGDLSQARDKGGAVKAMLYVDPFLPAAQYIVRCYNGVTGTSYGNCGFTVTRTGVGKYQINPGFQVDDRFVSITPSVGTYPIVNVNGNTIYLEFYSSAIGDNFDSTFTLFVY
jgi:hypothetical protein